MVALRISLPKPYADVLERTRLQVEEAVAWEVIRGEYEDFFATTDKMLDLLDGSIFHLFEFGATGDPIADQQYPITWSILWGLLFAWGGMQERATAYARTPLGQWYARAVGLRYRRVIHQTRTLLTGFPSLSFPSPGEVVASAFSLESDGVPDQLVTPDLVAFVERLRMDVQTIRISPLAHLRAMCNLWWSAVRHPFSETTIDLSTGRVLSRA